MSLRTSKMIIGIGYLIAKILHYAATLLHSVWQKEFIECRAALLHSAWQKSSESSGLLRSVWQKGTRIGLVFSSYYADVYILTK